MATMPQHYKDPLSQESAPSLSFDNMPIGTTYTGVITVLPRLVQSLEFGTKKPKTWPDGNAVMAVVIGLNVNGEARSLWATKPSSMFAALVAAQKAAGGTPMAIGGTLHVRLIGEQPGKNPKLHPAKQYQAKYVPPTNDMFKDEFAPDPSPRSVATPPPTSPPAPQAGKINW